MYNPSQKYIKEIAFLELELKQIISNEPKTHFKNKRYKEILSEIDSYKEEIKRYSQTVKSGVKF